MDDCDLDRPSRSSGMVACDWANWDFSCVPTSGDIPLGEPCGFINDCAEGTQCTNAEVVPGCLGSACCAAYCDLTLGDPPWQGLPGTACLPFFEEAPPGDENIGICIIP